jgi:integrase
MRNIIVLLNSIFHLAVDNDLLSRSPVRDRHKPVCHKTEKPAWTPEQVRKILESVPVEHRCLFTCAALTGLRLGELLALQWRSINLQNQNLAGRAKPLEKPTGFAQDEGEREAGSARRVARRGAGIASRALGLDQAGGLRFLQAGWSALQSRRFAQGCAVSDAGPFEHSAAEGRR